MNPPSEFQLSMMQFFTALLMIATACFFVYTIVSHPPNKTKHECMIAAINICGKDNVKWSEPKHVCHYECKDYSQFLHNEAKK